MAIYELRVSSSNELINIIKWDGISTYTTESGTILVPYTTESYIQNTSSVEFVPGYIGNIGGNFNGNLTEKTFFNEKPLSSKFNETQYGELIYTSSISGGNPSSSYFSLDKSWEYYLTSSNSGSLYTLTLPVYNVDTYKDFKYRNILQNIITYNKINSIIKLNSKYGFEYKYLKIVGITNPTASVVSSSIISFEVEELDSSNEKPKNNEQFNIDFITDANFGSFSGSFTGSLEGTASYALNFTGVATSALTAISSSYATFAETASKVEVFTTSSNWTKPSWAKTVKVVCVGGGGGGGGSFGSTSGIVTGGGGGAGGSVSMGEFDGNLLPTSSISITVGAGGTAGIGQDGGGSSGGSSMFDTLLIAQGGNGGQGGTDFGGSLAYVNGGKSSGTISYLNTGGGPGGRGCVGPNDIDPGYIGVKMCVAPSLPLNGIYVDLNWNLINIPDEKVGIPAAIAPTGGGGGLGYDADNGGNQDGETTGGSINTNSAIKVGDQNKSPGLVGKIYTYSLDGYVPAFYTKIGLGGNGGNPSASLAPSGGSRYGGGGGGAYGYYGSGSSAGANGADGVVIIISEA